MNFTLDHLFFSYKKSLGNCLSDISFTCLSNKVTGLAGANGSGKTTLIKIMLGQLIGFTGNYSIDAQKITDTFGNIPALYSIGYAPDASVLDDTLTGLEILSLVAEIRNVEKPAFEKDLASFKSLLHIEDWISNKKCSEYSTGMKKKINLAIALLGKPAFAVLDEPTNGLDPISVFGLKKLILEKKDAGTGCLVASHILDFVEKIADDVLLLKNGTLSYGGSLTDIKTRYSDKQSLEEIYFTLFNS